MTSSALMQGIRMSDDFIGNVTEEASASDRKVILVADDSHLVRSIVVQSLRTEFDVLQAENGCQVLDILQTRTVDLLILDLAMPVMDGRETLKLLRKSGNGTPVIVLTGEVRTSVIGEVLMEGVEDYVLKPVTPAEIRRKVRVVLKLETEEIERPESDILLVDPVPVVAKKLKRHLPKDIEIKQAHDFSAAVEACRAFKFKVILVDMQIPEIGGAGLASQLRILQPGTSVFGLYVRDINTGKADVMHSGFDGYLFKPFESNRVKELLKSNLGRAVAEPVNVDANKIILNDFPMPKEQRQAYAVRLRQESIDGVKVIAGACFETVILDLTIPPPREILLSYLVYLHRACSNIGLTIFVVADDEVKSLIKTTGDTAALEVFETLAEAEKRTAEIEEFEDDESESDDNDLE